MRRITEPVSVLMPVCNEVAVIENVVREWESEVFRYLPPGSELVFDDGDSRDGTLAKLEALRSELPLIRILCSPRDGFGAAARRLYNAARCPLVFFTDADGQYVAREFWKVAEALPSCDMAHGAKVDRQDPVYRKAASACFNRIAGAFFPVGIADINSAFRLLPKAMVDDLVPRIHCMPTLFNAELLLRAVAAGYTVKQVDVEHRSRGRGESRGLPAGRFARECLRAYRGLKQLRDELRAEAAECPLAAPSAVGDERLDNVRKRGRI
jgi:dolichol-phosphate mannosyltransferase